MTTSTKYAPAVVGMPLKTPVGLAEIPGGKPLTAML
jgi:hypothetical protein